MRARDPEDSPFPIRAFPYWVALGSLLFALAMFFTNTVPALREQRGLRDVEVELAELLRQYEDAIEGVRLAAGPQNSANYDLQSLLVMIDRQGYTPAELFLVYPESTPSTEERSSRPESR